MSESTHTTEWPTAKQKESYENLRVRFPDIGPMQGSIGMDSAVVVKASPHLWVVIETDGYTHS